jgi:serine protease Do
MKRFAKALGVVLLATSSVGLAHAQQQQQQARSEAYPQAEQVYQRFSDRDRVLLQLLLISAGFLNAVPNVDFNSRTFEAIRAFQQNAGLEANGALNPQQVGILRGAAAQPIRQWQFREIQHPTTQRTIWVPAGLGLTSSNVQNGVQFTNRDRSLTISFLHFPATDFAAAPQILSRSVTQNGGTISFEVRRPDFFVIGNEPSQGRSGYMRFHREPKGGMSGFMMQWSTAATELRGDRIATLVSASLWDSANRTGLMRADNLTNLVAPPPPPQQQATPPQPQQPQQAQSQPAQPAPAQPRAESPPQPARQEQPPAPRPSISTGTGFFVSREGHILTNAHVVDGCAHVEVRQLGQPGVRARIMARDRTNDLAIVASDVRSQAVGAMRSTARLGEQVVTFGFPLAGSLSSSGNFTIGNVTSLAGLGDDSRFVQMSTPVQPGNSGGALVDQSGHIVGVVTSKLNAVRTAAATGDIPQNVNFAVKSQIAMGFLETHRVPTTQPSGDRILSPVELADAARAITVQLVCQTGQ